MMVEAPPPHAPSLHGAAELQQRQASHAHASSHPHSQPQQQGKGPPTSGLFVDAITGRHAATSAVDLLAARKLTWNKHYGWT